MCMTQLGPASSRPSRPKDDSMGRVIPFRHPFNTGETTFWRVVRSHIAPFLEDECNRFQLLGKKPHLCAEQLAHTNHMTLLFRALRAERRFYFAITVRDYPEAERIGVEVKVLTADMTSFYSGTINSAHYRNVSRSWFEETYFDAIDTLSAHPPRNQL
jgi:hypothetical protein